MTLLKAKAKINLFFHITGKREDGYHLIESLAVFANDVYDSIEISSSDINETRVVGGEFAKYLQDEKNNLIDKALSAFTNNQKYNCKLTKNIPIGAGLGGGSSDAAIVAKFLTHSLKKSSLTEAKSSHISSSLTEAQPEIGDLVNTLDIPGQSAPHPARDDAREINSKNNPTRDDEWKGIVNQLAKIGADLPICYYGEPTYCSGIGEIIEPVSNFPKLYVVLVNPRKELLTKDVFIANKKTNSIPIINRPLSFFNSPTKLIDFLKNTDNVLTESASKLMPEIKIILNILEKQKNCVIARMSGSGPTCFGIFTEHKQAILAQEEISKIYPKFWVKYSTI